VALILSGDEAAISRAAVVDISMMILEKIPGRQGFDHNAGPQRRTPQNDNGWDMAAFLPYRLLNKIQTAYCLEPLIIRIIFMKC
jgi:hypothetical protein